MPGDTGSLNPKVKNKMTDKNAKFITEIFWSLVFCALNLFGTWNLRFGIS
jgi:hypothetical protein